MCSQNTEETKEKRCYMCKEKKPMEHFYSQSSRCKLCEAKRWKQRKRTFSQRGVFSYNYAMRRNRSNQVEAGYTKGEVIALFETAENHGCAYCGDRFDMTEYLKVPTLEHIEPWQVTARKGFDAYGNLTVICRACNGRKTRTNLIDYFRKIHENGNAHLFPTSALVAVIVRKALLEYREPAEVFAEIANGSDTFELPELPTLEQLKGGEPE